MHGRARRVAQEVANPRLRGLQDARDQLPETTAAQHYMLTMGLGHRVEWRRLGDIDLHVLYRR